MALMGSGRGRLFIVLPTLGGMLLIAAAVLRVFASTTIPFWLPEASAAAGLALVLSVILLRPRKTMAALTGRWARYGNHRAVVNIAFMCLLVMVNFLASRYHRRWDLTETRRYTLSPETVQILRSLRAPVRVTGFFAPGDSRTVEVEGLLKAYADHSHLFTYEVIDPEQHPGEAKRLGVTTYGTLVFQYEDARIQTFGLDEEDLTGALLRVTRPEPQTIYFTTGHGERSPESPEPTQYGTMSQWLARDNYRIALLNLATLTGSIPTDAAAIIAADPKALFAEAEVRLLSQWLDNGGRLMILTEPMPKPNETDSMRAFEEMLREWGVAIRSDLVLDPASSFFGDPTTPVVSRYRFSSITKGLAGLTTFFPTARSIQVEDPAPEDIELTPLIESSRSSWGETDLENPQVRFDEGQDTPGPLVLAVAGEDRERVARLVLFGDADFVSNEILNSVSGAFGNGELFRNAVNWLTEEDALLAIGPRPPDIRVMPPLTSVQRTAILYTTTILLPLAVLIVGGIIWWGRR